MDYNHYSDTQINAIIAKFIADDTESDFSPCSNINDAWKLIVEQEISIIPEPNTEMWVAVAFPRVRQISSSQLEVNGYSARHANPLRAAMLAYMKMMETYSLDRV